MVNRPLFANSPTALPYRRLSSMTWLTLLALLTQLWSPLIQRGPGQTDFALPFVKLPLSFAPNHGQADPEVRAQAYGRHGTVSFMQREVVLTLPDGKNPPATLRLRFDGANTAAEIVTTQQQVGVINSFVGAAPSGWHANIPTYTELAYHQLYAGVDLNYDGHDGLLKGTYVIAPGGDPARIVWRYEGARNARVNTTTGDLEITLVDGRMLTEQAPIAWQEGDSGHTPIAARYTIATDGSVGFKLGSYDLRRPLTIDPTLVYGTFIGGTSTDDARATAVDKSGNVYITGQTFSADFPGATGARQGNDDVFVTKLNAAGTVLIYTTILGGNNDEIGNGIAVDGAGNAWLTGATESTDFPTHNPLQAADFSLGYQETFATKLDPQGAISFSSYLGEPQNDQGNAITLDRQGNAYITGEDSATYGKEAFVRKVAADGSRELYHFVFGAAERGFDKGSTGRAIAVDGLGNAYIAGKTNSLVFPVVNAFQAACAESDGIDCTGDDAFVVKLNPVGNALLYGSYLGGSSAGSSTGSGGDEATGIGVDGSGNIYVTGLTYAPDFPTRNALQATKKGANNFADAFVTKLTPQGNALVYSTYLGSDQWDEAHGIAVDPTGIAYVTGITDGHDFPVSSDAVQRTLGAGVCIIGSTQRYCYDSFVTKLSATGSAIWSTYLGGEDDDIANGIALDGTGNVYVTGTTASFGFPTTTDAFQPTKALSEDAFVVKIGTPGAPPPSNKVFVPVILR